MARPRTGETPLRGVKIGEEWEEFGEAVGERNRSKRVREGIAWFLAVRHLWAHYVAACKDDDTTPAEDLRAYVEKRVRDWHRQHAGE